MRILIGDDDRVFAELTANRLRAKGIETAVAFDTPTVMMMAVRNPPDLIILDILMPGGSGLDTLQRLKISARTEPVPVIVVTASTAPEAEGRAMEGGARGFLRKPLEAIDLYSTIDRIMGTSLAGNGTSETPAASGGEPSEDDVHPPGRE
jgi:DNA-binding response OmpR family regulator